MLAKSSNIGAIQIALKSRRAPLYKYQRLFGFGQKTGIELPGESARHAAPREAVEPSSIGSLAMGHEVSVTSMQLALAGAVDRERRLEGKAPAGDGASKAGPADGAYSAPRSRSGSSRPETAITMRQMMEGVVLRGTGRGHANLRGYTSGGKTGSAQIYDFKAHAYTHNYNASFLGFAPVANPQIVIAVTLNETTGGSGGLWRTGCRAGFSRGGHVRAADAGRAQGSAGHRSLRAIEQGKRERCDRGLDSLQIFRRRIAGAGAVSALRHSRHGRRPGSGKFTGLTSCIHRRTVSGQADRAHATQCVSSVTPPPVQRGSQLRRDESSPDRRPFLPRAQTSGGPRVPDFSRDVAASRCWRNRRPPVSPWKCRETGWRVARTRRLAAPLRPHARVRVQFER